MATQPKNDGPRVIDSIIDHFTSQRRSIVVPEWGDIEIFFTPISYEELQEIDERNPKSNFERTIQTLVLKALDKDGARIFRWGRRRALDEASRYDRRATVRVFDDVSRIGESDGRRSGKLIKRDGFLRFRISLALELGKSLGEINDLPIGELKLYAAYLRWRETEREKMQKRSRFGRR